MTNIEPAMPSGEYTLSELAAASGVSERTIRYYQAEKLIAKPSKRGRDRTYRDDHLDRLRLIVELRDRGLTLHTIGELVANANPARTVATWLGVDATLSAPWSDDRPTTMTNEALQELVHSPGVAGELSDAHFIERGPDGRWIVPSPTLLDLTIQLQQAGIDVDISGTIRDLLRRRLARAVDDTVKLLVDRAGAGFAGTATPDELETALGALRPIAREMSSLIVAQEVERALAELLHSRPRTLTKARHR